MSAWETYWTAGYTVEGSSPTIVDQYCRTRAEAERKANEDAHRDLRALNGVGIEHSIGVWVEKWRTRRVEERDDREVVKTLTSKRRIEPRDRTLERAVGVAEAEPAGGDG